MPTRNILFLCAIGLWATSDAQELGPFGVHMGMTHAELVTHVKIQPISGRKNEYLSMQAPIKMNEFNAYIYTISPKVGLCRVTAIKEAALESEILDSRNKIGRTLEKKYGFPQKKGENFVWRPSNNWNIQEIVLRVDKQGKIAGLRLGYIFSNFSECEVADLKIS